MDFKRVTLSVYDDYMAHYRQCMIPCSETSFLTVFLEGAAFDVVQAYDSGFYWHKMTWDNETAWLPPVGDWDSIEDWPALLEKLVPPDTTFVFVPAYLMRKWQQTANRFEIEDMRSEWDYIYSIQKQAESSGKAYSNWRKDINHFKKLYPEGHVDSITADITEEIKAFQARWMAANEHTEKMTDELQRENIATLFMLDNWDSLPNAVGKVLRVDDQIIAFIVVEKLDEHMVSGHFLKADSQYAGAARFLKNSIYHDLLPEYVMINAWGDSDLPGLRHNKLQENPITLYKKYKIHWKG